MSFKDNGGEKIINFKTCSLCGGGDNVHQQRHITYGSNIACVDEEIADIILFCWQNDIETQFSCIGIDCPCDDVDCKQEAASIMFWRACDVEKFIELISNNLYKDYFLSGCFEDELPKWFEKFNNIKEKDFNYNSKRNYKVHFSIAGKVSSFLSEDKDEVEGSKLPAVEYREFTRWHLHFNRELISKIKRVLIKNNNFDDTVIVKNSDGSYYGAISRINNKFNFYGAYLGTFSHSNEFLIRTGSIDFRDSYEILKTFSVNEITEEKFLADLLEKNRKFEEECNEKLLVEGLDLLNVLFLYDSNISDKSIEIYRDKDTLLISELEKLEYNFTDWRNGK